MEKSNTVLVTGGAGYIGSHAVYAFLEAGWQVVVVDTLVTGLRHLVAKEAVFYEANAGDITQMQKILQQYQCCAVVHFAGSVVVPESVENPLKYYHNNTTVSNNLLQASVAAGVEGFLFSSTAAVYGSPEIVPVGEKMPRLPINPYGRSKLLTEYIVQDAAKAHGFSYGILRYFNVAGADPQARTGQSTPHATHLIKIAAEVASGKRPKMQIFGTDYPTSDGSCVRDYIHVTDLAQAHVQALEHILHKKQNITLNCGYGHGYSVREVLAALEQVIGRKIDIEEAPRRAGDPACLIADTTQIRQLLQWQPQYDDLPFIIESALRWEQSLR